MLDNLELHNQQGILTMVSGCSEAHFALPMVASCCALVTIEKRDEKLEKRQIKNKMLKKEQL